MKFPRSVVGNLYERPLTAEESTFAGERLPIVWKYLGQRRLDRNEWFDVVVPRYLLTVKRWFTLPELRAHGFDTLAWWAMRSAVYNEFRRRRSRPQEVSLFAPIPGANGLTLEDILVAPQDERLAAGF